MQPFVTSALVLLALLFVHPARAHVGAHPSVHDTVAGIKERLKREVKGERLLDLSPEEIEKFLTPREREILGKEHVSFRVNVPVTVSVIRSDEPKREPFWLKEQGFRKSDIEWTANQKELSVWQRDFAAGWVGLGVNSLEGGGDHYFVAVAPKSERSGFEISEMYPGQLRQERLKEGARPYVDQSGTLPSVPDRLAGHVLVQTQHRARDDAKLKDIFRWTAHPAGPKPDQVVLTWNGDPQRTQAIQWRTSARIKRSVVRYQKKSEAHPIRGRASRPKTAKGKSVALLSSNLINDPEIRRHTAVIEGLEPGETYVYTVGDGGKNWSAPAEFTTAPGAATPFSFVYMGDAQNGLDRWGTLLKNAQRHRPDAAFYIMAGDLVNRGADRDDWDSLFHNSTGVYDHKQLVPAIGNHECQGGHPGLYLQMFDLPENGPEDLESERAYSFEYSNALFVILDSNVSPALQTEWLEEQLARSAATWKFVVYHHPAYSSAVNRDNKEVRNEWAPVFDRYHVDMALQGHDHAYLRTYPMKDEKRMASPAEGTVYIVSVSGTKFYKQDPRDYTEFGMTNVSTYQTLDIQISGDRLVYRAYDIDGKLRDELVIEKPAKK